MSYYEINYDAFHQIHIDYARKQNLTGKNICVAVLDTGIGPHIDFGWERGRVLAFYDCVNGRTLPYDDNSHGSHVAGIIGSSGRNERGERIGIAPECQYVIVKVLDSRGNGKVENVIEGLQWVRENTRRYGIQIVNISVGTPAKTREDETSELVREVEKTWESGLIVIVAAGNNGPNRKTITVPGISRKVITVGASDDEQFARKQNGKIHYSGRGPTIACVKKPDLVAPGANIYSCTPFRTGYSIKSGTSMSTPIVTGAVALLLQKYPYLTNGEVKRRLWNCADDLGMAWEKQGYGQLNLQKLLSNMKE